MNVFEMLDKVHNLEGDYCECGVWQGFMAEHIAKGMNQTAKLWLLDSFEGHGQPSEYDLPKYHPQGRYSDTSARQVLEKLPSGIVYVPVIGFIPGTLPYIKTEKFRFCHIDLDHYLPTKAACEFFKARMVPGGIIRFDDYLHGETPGATKAINEVFGERNILTCDYRWEHNPTEGDLPHA